MRLFGYYRTKEFGKGLTEARTVLKKKLKTVILSCDLWRTCWIPVTDSITPSFLSSRCVVVARPIWLCWYRHTMACWVRHNNVHNQTAILMSISLSSTSQSTLRQWDTNKLHISSIWLSPSDFLWNNYLMIIGLEREELGEQFLLPPSFSLFLSSICPP